MKSRGRPVVGGFAGFFFGVFAGIDLLLFGVVSLDSILLTILPVAGLILGVGLALWAPFGSRTRPAPASPAAAPQPASAEAVPPTGTFPADDPPPETS